MGCLGFNVVGGKQAKVMVDQYYRTLADDCVPELAPEWATTASRYLDHEMLLVGPGVKTGMPIRMENPRELGPDRLVNATNLVTAGRLWSLRVRQTLRDAHRGRACGRA